MQLTKFSKIKIIHTPGKNLTVADMLSRTFTKEQLHLLFNPLFRLNPNIRDPLRTKQNHSYYNQLSSMTLIFLVIKMNQINHKLRRIKEQTH